MGDTLQYIDGSQFSWPLYKHLLINSRKGAINIIQTIDKIVNISTYFHKKNLQYYQKWNINLINWISFFSLSNDKNCLFSQKHHYFAHSNINKVFSKNFFSTIFFCYFFNLHKRTKLFYFRFTNLLKNDTHLASFFFHENTYIF
jgi:hypothetical protein